MAAKEKKINSLSTEDGTECGMCHKLALINCTNCSEYYCSDCIVKHTAQKFAKNHVVISIADMNTRHTRDERDDTCEPCSVMNKSEMAFMFCKDCEERLCLTCTAVHKSQKMSKSHPLVSISDYQKPEKVTMCEPCSERDLQLNATAYCVACQEDLCFDCGKRHNLQKETRNHELVDMKIKQQTALMYSTLKTVQENQQEKEKQKKADLRPGKPFADNILSDSLVLQWEVPNKFESNTPTYQLRYKERANRRWTFHTEQPHRACVTIMGLKSNSIYIFQVRAIDDDIEGPYSSESEEVTTTSSLASRWLPFTTKQNDGNPSIHKLNITENVDARDEQAKTRKFDLGEAPKLNDKEKTILLVGATGSGKSTLVNGIINYITGVNWKDPIRFTLIDLESDEKNKNQAVSQTEWITCYSVNPEKGSRLNYRLNIIDTPGFGDTRGLERDKKIVNQLHKLFSSEGEKGVLDIDAVCFLMKAPDARLTAVQKYIFMSILSLFGQDIKDNICTLITFADGETPPVLSAMQEAKLPVKSWYPFNNSGLFANNGDKMSSLSPMFWEMGSKSFKSFFDSLQSMPRKSLQQTKQVLVQRERLETTICQLQPQVDAGLSKVHELHKEIQILTQNEKQILDNKEFVYDVPETKQIKTFLPPRQYVTNCITCNRTCHYPCAIPKDDDKRGCGAMDNNGYCTVCPGNCFWNEHCNSPYSFTYVKHTVRKTYSEKQKLYQEAGHKKLTHEQIIKKMEHELETLLDTISNMMLIINKCNNTLKDIALHPHPLSMVEHIDLMIASERMEMKYGFVDRIKVLHEYRKRAEIHKDVDKLKEALRHDDFKKQIFKTK